MLAGPVALISHRLLGEHGGLVDAELGGSPARAFGRVGGQEHLEVGVGRDHGADVAALGHPVAVGQQLALLGAVAGLASQEGVEVVGMEAADVSYPGFADDIGRLLQ